MQRKAENPETVLLGAAAGTNVTVAPERSGEDLGEPREVPARPVGFLALARAKREGSPEYGSLAVAAAAYRIRSLAESGMPSAAVSAAVGGPEATLRGYLRAMSLKRLYRQGWLKRGLPKSVCESVADHSYGTAILALFLAGRPPFDGVDPAKACMMALAHELCEVYAGDITPVDGVDAEEKQRLERDSLERATDGLAAAGELRALWEEFEEGSTPEAAFVRRLDRLEMGIQAAVYRAEGRRGMDEFLSCARAAVGDGFLRDMLELAARRVD